MTINEIKEDIISELQKIKTINGYSIDIKAVFPLFMAYQDINEYPSLAVSLLKVKKEITTMGDYINTLTFGLIGYAQVDNDILKQGDLEVALVDLFDAITDRLLASDFLSSVTELNVGEYVVESEGNTGMIATTITIIYYQ